ncbi:hypothetical protein [Streptantibioticus ferralitis]|uniref:Uncharacterized protein n=1 Tax=Streptantibioticus ferralitis TaxID=236510 RepID=A0ABT5YSN4_9ACTN|nr:hypothetical protein [Streptantibioticus ferralitis]MDF2254614.1 hypothetical protein [Streptantibioticus ferralitis]
MTMPGRAGVARVDFGLYGFGTTSIERTAYPRFKRLITARELHLFFSPSREEVDWPVARTDSDGHQLALLLLVLLPRRSWKIDPEDLAEVSPYLTKKIMRFGEYSTLELDLAPEAYEPHLDVDFSKLDPQHDAA